MGWKLSAFLLVFALMMLGAGAFVIGVPILLYLVYKWWSNRRTNGAGHSRWMIYLGLLLLLLSVVAAANQGTFSPIVFGGSGVLLLVLALFPGVVHGLLDQALEVLPYMRGRRNGEPGAIPCVELTQVPLDYLDPKKAEPKERLLKLQRVVQSLAEVGGTVELRIAFADGSGRVTFTPIGRDVDDRARKLLLVARAHLPEFGPEPAMLPPEPEDSFSASVEGVPEPSVDPLGPLAGFFVENRLDGQYVVTVSQAWINPVSRWLAQRKQRKIAESSGYQRVDDDRTTTVVDHPKQVELEEAVKGLERLSARTPLRVSVQVSAQEEGLALQAARVLAGTLSSQRRISGLKVGTPRASGKLAWRRSTLMAPSEAAPYFWLPQASLGMKVAPSAEFQEPTTEGEVVLGEVVGLSGRNGHQVRVSLDQLTKHVFVTGMTGSGKTTSCFGLLLQLHRQKIPFLVIEPAKSEYRSLLAAIAELQVFTIGDEETAPFRLNMFEPPPGVKVQAHLENLEAVWNSSFVSYAPLPYVVKQVFAETYGACGWDIARNVRGRAVAFDDVRVQVERVVRGLGYERDVTMDVEAALKTRLMSLTLGGKGPLFGAVACTPLEEVQEKPTVIELREIQNDEEKAFVAALLMMNVASYVQAKGGTRRLRHFTLIEEAHRLLPNVSTEKGDPESADPRRRMVEQFGNMLAELRAYGEGLAVVEQIPTKILPDAIKNTATKMVHRVPALDDRRVMAGAMNATKEQAAVFTALRPGEAVLGLEGHPVPARVDVEDVVAKLGVPVGEVTDGVVKRQMADFYLRNPLPKEHQDARDARVRKLVEEEQFRREFLRTYRVWLKTGDVGPLREFLVQSARSMAMGPNEMLDLVSGVLRLATAYYLPFNEEDRAKFPQVIMREVRGSIGRG